MITSTISRQQHHLPRFLTTASRVAMTMLPSNVIMTNIKYLFTINERNSTPEAVYICLRTKKKGIPWYDDWIKNLYELKSRVHPSGDYVDHQRREVPTLAPEEDDNFEWRLAIERRQLASERQLKALLQETERLREETLCYASRLQHQGHRDDSVRGPSSKLKASTRTGVNISWDNRSYPGARDTRPHEPRTPMPRAPREESSDSTHFSAKKQRDKKSQLSNSMRARLGP
ncbi:hypothetical protein CK203_054940 [Vitis vinifera]|uniref:Uncharacterized protein n=1 Tax=Vitis vinifera TaxID=29760 RepID=A0A438GJ69_VITVI|nr:hypothetical protein CK203_054940 [Vitis vinifera]